MKPRHYFTVGFAAAFLIMFLALAIQNRMTDLKPCDRVCNKAQCACVETCPHER